MAEKKKTNTSMLDVGAMYQIGAAGAGAGAGSKSNNEGLKWLSQIGRFAFGFKMRSIENFKAASANSNKAFASLEDAVLSHDLDLNKQTLEEVKNIKLRVTNADKTMNGIKYSWRPESDEYTSASNDKTKALLELKKLEKANLKLSTEFKEILLISNGEKFEKGKDGNQYQVKLYGTEEEMYNASLMAKGMFAAAREWDSENGEYMINMQLLGDNPDTEIDERTLGKVALSEFKFARQNNPSQTDPGSAYINQMIKLGASGSNMTSSSRQEFISGLEQDLGRLGPRDFSELMEVGTIQRGGESVSYIDAIVNDQLGTLVDAVKGGVTPDDDMIDNPSFVEGGDEPEKILESELYALSIIGAKETIKNEIINAGPNSEYVDGFKKKVKDLVETNAEERYEEELENFETNKEKNKTKTNSRKGLRSRSRTTKEINAAIGKGDGTVLGPDGALYTWDGGDFTTDDGKVYSPEQVFSIVAQEDARYYKRVPLP